MGKVTRTFGSSTCENPQCGSVFVRTGPRQRWCDHACRDSALLKKCIGCEMLRPQSSFHRGAYGGTAPHCLWCEYESGRRKLGQKDAFARCYAACSRAIGMCVRPASWGKTCTSCQEWRPRSAYRFSRKSGQWSSDCAWCHTTNGSFIRHSRRILASIDWGVCGVCTSSMPLDSMVFRPTKGTATTHHCPSCKRETNYRNAVRKKYGLEIEDVRKMFDDQEGKCALCPTDLDPITFRSDAYVIDKNFEHRRNMHIDHCHDTGIVRGLLCRTCNVNLPAHLDPDWFERAADYLRAA